MKEMALIAQKLKNPLILGGYEVVKGPKNGLHIRSIFIFDQFFLQTLKSLGPKQSITSLY